MVRTPENPYRVAVREFPKRLKQGKKHYELENRGGEDLDWLDLAKKVGLKKSAMSEIKTGKRPPRLAEIVRFCEVLGLRPEWLAFDSGTMVAVHVKTTVVGATGQSDKRQQHA